MTAVYGADAVAGVVNNITKNAMDSGEAAIRYGQTTRSDGAESSADLSWGITGSKGSMMTAINYAKGAPVSMPSRAPCGLGASGNGPARLAGDAGRDPCHQYRGEPSDQPHGPGPDARTASRR